MPATLARLLVEGGVVNRTQADDCLRRHLQVGGALDTVLLEARACREDVLLAYLAQAAELPAGFPHQAAEQDGKVVQVFPFKLAERHGMVPLLLGKRHVEVAACYPVEKLLLEELSFMLGRDLRPQIAIEARVREAISNLYGKPLAPRFAALLKQLGPAPTALPDLVEVRAVPAPKPLSEVALGRAANVGSVSSWPPPARPALAVEAPPPLPKRLPKTAPAGVPTAAPRNELAELPTLEGIALADAHEEDAAALLPPEPPPPEPRPAPVEIEVVIEPAVPASAVPEPVESPLVAPACSAEEDVRLDDEPAFAAPPPTAPMNAPPPPVSNLARPPSTSLDTRDMLATWRPGGDLGLLEDALAGVDLSAFSEPAAEVAAAEVVAPSAAQPALNWTLSQARALLAAAPARDGIIEVALKFAAKSFEYAAALAIRSGTAFGWAAIDAQGTPQDPIHRLALPLDTPSVLRTVLRARGRYLGPLPDDELTEKFLRDMGRERPQVALLYPVFVRERPVAIFYADRGRRHVAAARVAEFLLFAQELSTAFERAILLGKKRSVRAVAEAPPLPAPPPFQISGPSEAPEETVEEEPFFPITEELPVVEPTGRTVEAIIADLLGTDRRRRLTALAELEAMPEQAAPALAAQFPGPTALRRGLVVDLPDAEELGPVLGALARMKRAALPYVDKVLREGNPDERFFAVLLAGSMRQAPLFPGIARALFDPVMEVAAAARAAAGSLRMVPGFEEVIARQLRQELGANDPDRVASAALAIGRTRDVQAIPLLIPLTGHADDRVAAEAGDALTQITKQTHGDSPRRWQAWWEQNKNRPRIAWLVEGLAHKDLQVRLSSVEELVEITNDSFGYLADGPRKEREKALERWDGWLKQRIR